MPFRTLPVNVTGPSAQSRSRPLSSQQTTNFYTELLAGGKGEYVLQLFPGQTLFSNLTGADRGSTQMLGIAFNVLGSTLFEVSSAGAGTDRGTIPGTARCIFANDGENLYIVSESRVFQYNRLTELIVEVLDSNITGAKSVAFLNNVFLYTFDNATQVSNAGDGATANGLNRVNAEVNPDALVRDYVFDQIIYRLGTDATETWWFAGTGQPPIEIIEPQQFSVGLAAIHSVANTDEFMYWLGDDRQVYFARGGSRDRVSSVALSNQIENFDVVSDAIGMTFTLQAKNYYMLKFPTADKTFLLNEELRENGWTDLSTGTNDGRYSANSLVRAYGKNLVTHETNGNIYELDINAFDEDGALIQRRRTMASIDGKALGMPGSRVQMSRFELILEKGTGLLTGQGEDPRIMIEYSKDGGKSFSNGTWMRIGRLGETQLRAEWYSRITFYDLIIRITMTDAVFTSIYRGAIDLRLAGR